MATDKAALEAAFVAVLDLLEEYLALQRSLGETLRTGYLNVSAGRWAMGAARVSSLQYPAHMQATSRVLVTVEGALTRVQSDMSKGGPGRGSPKAAVASKPAPQPTASVQSSVAAPDSGSAARPADATEGASARLSASLDAMKLAEDTHSFVSKLAAKYHCDELASEAGVEEHASSQLQKKPLHWFGVLVAPQLREAEKNFNEGLDLALQTATVRQRLLARLAEYRELSAAAGMGESTAADA